jgi:superfamily I DNA/RNA helicase
VPEIVPPAPPEADPFAHPAAQRRFRVVDDVDALATALDAPWEQWAVFLHPSQRELVERDFGGPARVSGSAGTGKTVVALHRAVHLAERDEHARVLLATFSDALARHLETKLRVLTRHRPRLRERIDVATLAGLAARLHRARFGRDAAVVDPATLASVIGDAASAADAPFAPGFLATEWDQVVDAWQLRTWDAYRAVPRLGRKVRLPESARARAWAVFERVWAELDARGLTTEAAVYQGLADAYAGGGTAPYAHVVLDEAQDASAAQLRFLAQLVGDRPNGLFFAGDLGQRIFQQPFSWLSVGVDVRGRARTLKVNYRTSHQIRTRADRLLDARTDDVDGETQERRGTISVFDGVEPRVERFVDADTEARGVGAWLRERVDAGALPHEVGVFVRHEGLLDRAHAALAHGGLEGVVLDGAANPPEGRVAIATMHRAKGLEYRAVAVMACDEDVLPLAERLAIASDMNELQEVHETERHLLYVAVTRARDELWVSGVAPGSDYLADL